MRIKFLTMRIKFLTMRIKFLTMRIKFLTDMRQEGYLRVKGRNEMVVKFDWCW
jgi:hypothetical protein